MVIFHISDERAALDVHRAVTRHVSEPVKAVRRAVAQRVRAVFDGEGSAVAGNCAVHITLHRRVFNSHRCIRIGRTAVRNSICVSTVGEVVARREGSALNGSRSKIAHGVAAALVAAERAVLDDQRSVILHRMTALRLDIGGIDDAIALNSEGSAVSNEGTGIRAREFFAAHVERYGLPFGNGDEPVDIHIGEHLDTDRLAGCTHQIADEGLRIVIGLGRSVDGHLREAARGNRPRAAVLRRCIACCHISRRIARERAALHESSRMLDGQGAHFAAERSALNQKRRRRGHGATGVFFRICFE